MSSVVDLLEGTPPIDVRNVGNLVPWVLILALAKQLSTKAAKLFGLSRN
jgi:hypothetical protein